MESWKKIVLELDRLKKGKKNFEKETFETLDEFVRGIIELEEKLIHLASE